jgi:predicted acylesterase/phospholipase RssA
MREEPYAIVFSGGGALGSWEVGAYKALRAHHQNQDPTVVTGASAGALNATAVCAGMSAEEIRRLWADLAPSDVYTLRFGRGTAARLFGSSIWQWSFTKALMQFLDGHNSLLDTSTLAGKLREIFPPHSQPFFQSRIRFVISLTDLSAGARRFFYKLPPGEKLPKDALVPELVTAWREIQSMEMLLQALMGTTALPVLFPPFEGLFDGGVLLNQPITPAYLLGALNIYVLIPSPIALGRTNNLRAIGSTLLSRWLSASLLSQIESVRLRNRIRGYTGDPKIRLCVIRPQTELQCGLLSFGAGVDALVADGERTARERLDRFDSANENTWY